METCVICKKPINNLSAAHPQHYTTCASRPTRDNALCDCDAGYAHAGCCPTCNVNNVLFKDWEKRGHRAVWN